MSENSQNVFQRNTSLSEKDCMSVSLDSRFFTNTIKRAIDCAVSYWREVSITKDKVMISCFGFSSHRASCRIEDIINVRN